MSERSDQGEDSASPFALLPVHALVQAAAVRHEGGNVVFEFSNENDLGADAGIEPVVARSLKSSTD